MIGKTHYVHDRCVGGHREEDPALWDVLHDLATGVGEMDLMQRNDLLVTFSQDGLARFVREPFPVGEGRTR